MGVKQWFLNPTEEEKIAMEVERERKRKEEERRRRRYKKLQIVRRDELTVGEEREYQRLERHYEPPQPSHRDKEGYRLDLRGPAGGLVGFARGMRDLGRTFGRTDFDDVVYGDPNKKKWNFRNYDDVLNPPWAKALIKKRKQ